jgi:hypothetical protein
MRACQPSRRTEHRTLSLESTTSLMSSRDGLLLRWGSNAGTDIHPEPSIKPAGGLCRNKRESSLLILTTLWLEAACMLAEGVCVAGEQWACTSVNRLPCQPAGSIGWQRPIYLNNGDVML